MDLEYFSFFWYFMFYGYVDDLLLILDEFEVELCIFVGYFVVGMVGCFVLLEWLKIFEKIIIILVFFRYIIIQNYFMNFEFCVRNFDFVDLLVCVGFGRYLNDIDYFGGFE